MAQFTYNKIDTLGQFSEFWSAWIIWIKMWKFSKSAPLCHFPVNSIYTSSPRQPLSHLLKIRFVFFRVLFKWNIPHVVLVLINRKASIPTHFFCVYIGSTFLSIATQYPIVWIEHILFKNPLTYWWTLGVVSNISLSWIKLLCLFMHKSSEIFSLLLGKYPGISQGHTISVHSTF